MGFPQQPVEQFLGEVEQSFWPAEIVVDVETVGFSVVSIDAEMTHQVAASVNERIGGGSCAQPLLKQRCSAAHGAGHEEDPGACLWHAEILARRLKNGNARCREIWLTTR